MSLSVVGLLGQVSRGNEEMEEKGKCTVVGEEN